MSATPIFTRSSGLNNVVPPLRAPYSPEEGVTGLTAAVNVEVDHSGMIATRQGYAKVFDGSWHSLFCTADFCLGVRGTELCRVHGDLNSYSVLASDVFDRLSYAQVNQDIFYTSRSAKGIVRDGVAIEWGPLPYNGAETNREFAPPFFADHIAFIHGRVWIARENVLVPSEPFGFHWFDMHGSSMVWDSNIRMLKPVRTGMFVSTDTSTYYIMGSEPGEFSTKKVADYPAIQGTAAIDLVDAMELGFQEPGDGAVWASEKGICFGTTFGFVVNLTHADIKFPKVKPWGCGIVADYKYLNTIGA